MKCQSPRALGVAALIGLMLGGVGCGATKHVETAPARVGSYECAWEKVVELGLEVYEEDVENRAFKAIRRTPQGHGDDRKVLYDQLEVQVQSGGDEDGALKVTVTGGELWSPVDVETQTHRSLQIVDTHETEPSTRGIEDARAVIEACSGTS